MNLKRIALAVMGSMLLLSPVILKAQNQQESVADAARKARAEKKPGIKPAVVYSNDNLDTIKGAVSVIGEEPAAKIDSTAVKVKTDADAEAPKKVETAAPEKAPAVKGEADWRKEFADARKTLADDSHELDVLQRELGLKSQQYYSDPNVAMKEQYTNDDLNKTKKEIDDKTAAVAKDKQAISDLQDALRQAGGDPGWGREP